MYDSSQSRCLFDHSRVYTASKRLTPAFHSAEARGENYREDVGTARHLRLRFMAQDLWVR